MTSLACTCAFAEIGLGHTDVVGGKGASLGELTHAGIDVPPGFVVTTHAFEQFLAALEAREPIRPLVEALATEDLAGTTALSRRLRARVEEEPLPASVERSILDAHGRLGAAHVAVRSSATTEDAEDASFAGLQDTFLWVPDARETLHRVRECRRCAIRRPERQRVRRLSRGAHPPGRSQRALRLRQRDRTLHPWLERTPADPQPTPTSVMVATAAASATAATWPGETSMTTEP